MEGDSYRGSAWFALTIGRVHSQSREALGFREGRSLRFEKGGRRVLPCRETTPDGSTSLQDDS